MQIVCKQLKQNTIGVNHAIDPKDGSMLYLYKHIINIDLLKCVYCAFVCTVGTVVNEY